MSNPLKVLLIDSPNSSTSQIREALLPVGFSPRFHVASSARELESALAKGRFDVALSEFEFGEFGAIEALDILKRTKSDLPFIVVSSVAGEEHAVAAIKAGADDFVLRSNAARLGESIREVVRSNYRRKDSEARPDASTGTEPASRYFRTVVENFPNGAVAMFDSQYRYIMADGSGLAGVGLSREKMEGSTLFEVFPRRIARAVEPIYTAALRGKRAGLEIRFGKKTFFVETFPVRDEGGEITGGMAVVQDTSEHWRAEEAVKKSEEQFAKMFHSSPVPICMTSLEGGRIFDMSESFVELFGYSREELVGITAEELNIGVDEEERKAAREKLFRDGYLKNFELRMRTKSGKIIDVLNSAEIIEHSGAHYVLGTCHDITGRKIMERALEDSDARYRALVSNFPNGAVFLFDEDLRFLLAEGQGLEDVGPSSQEFVGKTLWEALPAQTCAQVEPLYRSALSGSEMSKEVSYGDRVYLLHAVPLKDEQGTVVAGMAMTQDITRQRRIENTLRESEELFRLITENASEMISLFDLHGRIVYTSPSRFRILGYKPEEVIGQDPRDYVHPDDLNTATKSGAQIATGETVTVTTRNRHADGSWRWLEAHATTVRRGEGIYILSVARDITDRIKAEETLREQEARLRMLVQQLPAIIWTTDSDLRYTSSDGKGLEEIGLRPGETNGMTMYTFFQTDDPTFPPIAAHVAALKGESVTVKTEWAERVFETHVEPLRYPDGSIRGTICLANDVTEQTHAEAALRESEARKAAVLETALDCIITINHEGRILEFNPAAEQTFGYRREDVIGQQMADLIIPPSLRHRHEESFARYLGTGEGVLIGRRIEITGMRADGSEFPAEVAITRVSSMEMPTFTGYIRDITERKRSEAALRESNERFELISRATNDALWDWNIATNEEWWNDSCYKLFGHEPETITPSWIVSASRIHPDDRTDVESSLISAINGGSDYWDYEFRILRPDGSYGYVFDRGQILRDRAGKPVRMVGAIMDTSHRKQAEQALRESERRLAEAQRIASMGSWTWQIASGQLLWSDNMFELFEISRDITPTYEMFVGAMLEEDRDRILAMNSELLGSEVEGYTFEFRIRLRNNRIRNMFAIAHINRDSHGVADSLSGTVQDITERKRAEEVLRESERRLEEAQSIASVGSWTMDAVTGHVDWSKQMYRLFGWKKKSPPSQTEFERILHSEDRQRALDTIDTAVRTGKPVYDMEYRIVLSNGSIRQIHGVGTIIRSEDGRLQMINGTAQDITDRKRAEKAVKDSEARLRQIVDLVPAAIYVKDRDGRFILANQVTASAFGREPEQIEGQILADLSPNQQEALGFVEDDRAVIESGHPLHIPEEQFTTPRGLVATLETHKIPFNIAGTGETAVLGVSMDITARKRAEEEREAVIQGAHCILWEGSVARIGKSMQWNIRVLNVEAARAFFPFEMEVPLSRPEFGDSYVQAFHHSITPEDHDRMDKVASHALRTGKSGYRNEYRVRLADGDIRWFLEDAMIKRIEPDKWRVIGVCTDITERKRAESALRASEEAERLLQERLTALNEVGIELSSSRTFDELCKIAIVHGIKRLGFERLGLWFYDDKTGDVIGSFGVDEQGRIRDERAVRRKPRTELRNMSLEVISGKKQYEYRKQATLFDQNADSVGVGECAAAALWDGSHGIGYLSADNLLSGEPISEHQAKVLRLYASMLGHLCTRKKAEDSLKTTNDQLRALTARLHTIREEERTHISHEIHDELGQALTALKMDVSWLNHKLDVSEINASPEVLAARTSSMTSLIDTTIKTVRRISTDLRPAVLDDLGVIAAVEWQTRDFQDRSGIICQFRSNVEEVSLPTEQATAAFRIIQEALTNVLRHANASEVSVSILYHGDMLTVEVKDNGVGVAAKQSASKGALGGGLGLIGMQERAHAIGGEIAITGEPGKGTVVSLLLNTSKHRHMDSETMKEGLSEIR